MATGVIYWSPIWGWGRPEGLGKSVEQKIWRPEASSNGVETESPVAEGQKFPGSIVLDVANGHERGGFNGGAMWPRGRLDSVLRDYFWPQGWWESRSTRKNVASGLGDFWSDGVPCGPRALELTGRQANCGMSVRAATRSLMVCSNGVAHQDFNLFRYTFQGFLFGVGGSG